MRYPGWFRVLSFCFAAGLLTCFAGCSLLKPKEAVPPVAPVVQQVLPVFPPQEVVKSGDFAGFLDQNMKTAQAAANSEEAAIALFNLGFLYSYSKSPYLNPAKALKYFDDLIKTYPDTPWACQAMVWTELMKKSTAAEKGRRKLQGELKSAQAAIGDRNRQTEETSPADPAPPADMQALEEQIRIKDETISNLNKQIERYRQIDIRIEKKERELLK